MTSLPLLTIIKAPDLILLSWHFVESKIQQRMDSIMNEVKAETTAEFIMGKKILKILE